MDKRWLALVAVLVLVVSAWAHPSAAACVQEVGR